MSEEVRIEDFLGGLRDEGVVESSSVFTLSPEEARRKLEEFQRATPAYYLLRLVQAAVAGGATQVRFRIGRHLTRVTIEGLAQPFLGDELDELAPRPTDPDWLSHLKAAVNAALCLKPSEMRVVYGEYQRTFVGEPGRSGRTKPGLHFEVRRVSEGLLGSILGDAASRGAEHRGLFQSGQVCPIPLRAGRFHFNQFDLTALLPVIKPRKLGRVYLLPGSLLATAHYLVTESEQSCFLSPGLVGGAGYHVGAQQVLANKNPGTASPIVAFHYDHFGTPLEFSSGLQVPPAALSEVNRRTALKCSRFLALRLHLEGPGCLFVVRHGILMGRIYCDLGCPGALALVAVDDVKTDASGLRPVLDDSLEDLIASLRTDIKALARRVQNVIREQQLLDRTPKVREWVQGRLRY